MSLLEIAKKINRKGDKFIEKNGIQDFHKKASELLEQSRLATHFNFQETVESSFNNPAQHFKNLEFSDLPITIAHGEHCFVDVYFWRRRPTVIHNHHFVGAFMCLEGNNIDLEFSFKKGRKLGKHHDLGELKLKRTKQMRPGGITEIAFMDGFIHQNHHQAELTVNLCFRTPQDPSKSLSNYLFTGLRYEKNADLISRVNRLLRFVDLGVIDFKEIKINNDEAINFLIQTHGTPSKNPRLLKLRSTLEKRIKNELGVDISKLIKEHDLRMEELENDYE